MKKYIVAIVILVAAAVPAYALWQMKYASSTVEEGAPSPAANQEVEGDSKQSAQAGQDNLMNLLRRDSSAHCQFESSDTDGQSVSGEIFIDAQNENFKGSFTATDPADESTTVTHVLKDEQWQYMWVDGQSQGYKFSFNESDQDELFAFTEEESEEASAEEDFAFKQDQNVEYSCEPWQPSAETFTPPSNIEFIDYQAQVDALMENMPESPQVGEDEASDICNSCDQLQSEEARQQCLAALGC